MLVLDASLVAVGCSASSKTEAIRTVGALLERAGKIERGYVDSMLARERVANTCLGQGIAIPHGLPKDRGCIRDTSIAVAQFPEGVEWNPGERVTLVVGIAARSDEHLTILGNLTEVLGDPGAVERLSRTADPAEIVARLSRGGTAAPAPDAVPRPVDLANGFEVRYRGAHGLHARPATALSTLAKGFRSTIRLRVGDQVADARSVLALLQLGVAEGAAVRVMAEGDDAERALAELRAAFERGLEDEAEARTEAVAEGRGLGAAAAAAIDWQARAVAGIAASPGLAVGPARQFQRGKIVVEATALDPGAERTRLTQALETARRELERLFEEVWQRSGAAKASIFRAHQEFLEDPELVGAARAGIVAGHSAGWAWRASFEERAATLARMRDPVLAGRAADLHDVGRRVLKLLADRVEDEPALPDSPVVLIADDLSPSDTARLDPAFALGLCTAAGGPTAHTAIIARSLGIPAVVAIGDSVLEVADGTPVILDGLAGTLVIDPTARDRDAARTRAEDHARQREAERRACYQPAILRDGARVEVVANIGAAGEAATAVEAGAEGVGLVRTEFLFLGRDSAPDEDEQAQAYGAMVAALNGLPLIIRTLDIGGDKEVPYLSMPAEANPFLGERGIRLCLARPELFRTQLRAIFRASRSGPIRIMYPMIATLEELERARSITEQVRREVGAEPVEIGIMVEVPSAVMMAEELARAVDFFSIGTNDLTQYTLAMDRQHPVLAMQADGLHPAVLRMIDRTVKAARAAGRWVGACGGIAGDPRGVEILVGLGLAELSVSIPSIAAVKAQIRDLTMAGARGLAERALACRNAAEVRALA